MITAKYTIVLKTLLDDPQSKELIDRALSTYPLYTAEHESKFTQVMSREEINKKILDHFKYREIGFETFGRFLDELEISMNEIMPYYNQLFLSEDIINGIEDIFGNLDVKEEFEQETTDTSQDTTTSTGSETQENESSGSNDSSSSSHGTSVSNGSDSSTSNVSMDSDHKLIKSQTPSSQLSITAKDMDSVEYADNVEWSKDGSSSSTENTGTTRSQSENTNTSTDKTTTSSTGSTEISKEDTSTSTGNKAGTMKHTLTRKGNQGVNTYAHDMLEFRNLFINIVQKIINDDRIQELFMQVY